MSQSYTSILVSYRLSDIFPSRTLSLSQFPPEWLSNAILNPTMSQSYTSILVSYRLSDSVLVVQPLPQRAPPVWPYSLL
jgi:hypothetical protein